MSKANILIVEDEAIVAADIEDCLRNLDYEVVRSVASGEDAISTAKERKPDLVLMDIKLKGDIDGIQAATEIREQIDIPVVYLTAHADDHTLERAKITEPYGYILKPFEQTELRITLELALHKHKLRQQTAEAATELEPETLSVQGAENAEFLSGILPFSDLSREGLAFLASHCHRRTAQSGELVALEGDLDVDGFIVISGRIAMLKTSSSGRELIVELLPPGDIFGLIATVDAQLYSFTARAQTKSEILSVPKSVILTTLDRYPMLYRGLLDVIASRLHTSHDFSRALAHDRVEIRIASALTALAPRFNSEKNSDAGAVIKITRQELADLTGTTVETAIRVTKTMERDSLLDLSDSGVIRVLELASLQELTEG